MARVPQITRTVKTTKATIMCLDIITGNSFNKEVNLPRTYKDDNAVLAKAKSLIEDEITRAVYVVSTETVEALYGMSEQTFIDNAEILMKGGRKKSE